MGTPRRDARPRIVVYGYPPDRRWSPDADVQISYTLSVRRLKQLLLDRPVDMVVSHHSPPNNDGVAAAKAVQSCVHGVPVLLASNDFDERTVVETTGSTVTWSVRLDGDNSEREQLYDLATDAGEWLAARAKGEPEPTAE